MTLAKPSIRIHLTNVTGTGAVQLLQSLLPAFGEAVSEIYLPDRGALEHYQPSGSKTRTVTYQRDLPNVLSRVLECTLFGADFEGETPLLVLGDLPLRCNSPQVVFVQTPHLLETQKSGGSLGDFKYRFSRWLFRSNLEYVNALIVQTTVMRDALITTYPQLRDKVYIVAQPVPEWLLQNRASHERRLLKQGNKLRLFYPAAGYPHKNHALLGQINTDASQNWPIEELTITLDAAAHPAPALEWLRCVGFLAPLAMISTYAKADALLFLSLKESYGFPLIEAMFLGLPIICPNLPYAKALCGEQAIYFEARDIDSLHFAVLELQMRLISGWQPDWSAQIAGLPQSWEAVAEAMLVVVAETCLPSKQ